MTWAHLVDKTTDKTNKINFDVQLLDQIEQKSNNARVKLTLKVSKDLCNAVDDSGASLLHYSAKFGNETITRHLIESGTKINAQNEDGDSPLSLATKAKHTGIIKILLECSNTDIYICNEIGVSAVQMALRTSPVDFEIVKLFLRRISNDCSSDDTEIIDALMKIKCPLYVAVLLERVAVTTGMLSGGCSIETKDPKTRKTALHFAVENVDLEHVQKLLFLGADVNAKDASGKPPLAQLSDFAKTDEALGIVKILLNKTPLTLSDKDGFMHMRSILRNGTANAVFAVLRRLNVLTVTDWHDQSIVHYLAGNYSPGIAEVVERFKIFEKVNLNARDECGLTALHCAMNVGNVQFVQRLASKGVNLHVLDHKGVSPLMQAVQPMSRVRLRQRVECVKTLLRSKAQPDIFMGQYFEAHAGELAIDRDYVLIEPAIALLAAWKAVKRPFNREILRTINSYPRLKRLLEVCTIELEKMRGERVCRNVTILDMLVEYEDSEYSRYSLFFVISGRLAKRWIRKYQSIPIYYEILDNRVDRVMQRKMEDLKSFMLICLIVSIMIGVCGVLLWRLYVDITYLSTLHN